MKHPVKFLALLFLFLTAVTAAILMTIRYMDVLQKQFDFLRGLLARRNGAVCDGDLSEEYSEANEEELGELGELSSEDFSADELQF